MKVSELMDIKNSRIDNRQKGLLIARMARQNAKKANPTDTEIPSGWNASPFPGSQTDRTGG
jgi:uncharacterized protein YbdZ (MbtH family)